ncbi:putative glycosyltransferase family 8 protein GLGEN [Mycena kentingensis (nom. inval.)]|nr:putative glycosyltransferase family 8 protein GLGEN [Mycena kentingensis (nom. inval.)]
MTPYAFATLLTSPEYLPGVLTVAGALRDLHTVPAAPPEVDFQTVCIVTPETVDAGSIRLLRKAFDVVVGVEIIAQEDDKGLRLLGRLDLNTVLTKLHVFRLIQYSKIIFLDADVLPVRPLSHLFTLPHEFSAVPDVGWPDIFNSGVLVLSPGEDKFNQLNDLLKTKGTWDGGDQGILNEWRGGDWNRLSFTYNTTPTAAYTYAPAYERFGSQIAAIHFIGPNKPWKSLPFRLPFQNQSTQSDKGPLQAYDYNTLIDRWFAVYDKHYRAAPVSQTDFEVKRYISAWDEQVGTGSELITESMAQGTALGLEDLRKMAIHGISSVASTTTAAGGEGEYVRMPLEGRIDLMRPKQPSPVSSGTPTPRASSPTRRASTPGPDEVPPSPHIPTISLPPTPSPAFFVPKQDEPQHEQQQQQQQHHQQQQHQPQRPPSPPMMLWNPATEPPPNVQPPPSAFPADTYFPNIWDQPHGYSQGPRPSSPPPPSNVFFQPPPQPEIPESLQGQYQQVTGQPEETGSNPNPDRSKVKSIFPWEDQPRQMPGRVFPAEDAPSPSHFVSPAPAEPPRGLLSPLGGLPETLAYANAWDTVPSIQRYASRLARPPPHVPLASPFDDDRYRRGRSWSDRAEISSMDGDDEDDGEDDDESRGGASESDRETNTTTATSISALSARSRGSSISATYSFKGKKKEYTVRGVQTISPKYRSQGTQAHPPKVSSASHPTTTTAPALKERRLSRPSQDGGKRQWGPAATDVLPPITSRPSVADSSLMVASPSSTLHPGSPRGFFPSPPTKAATGTSPPITTGTSPPTTMRSPEGTLFSPLSPADGARKGSRVWDPNRAVEVFKQGSEEVLARFLRMGGQQWEDEQSQQQ